jgi:hypothetical protein
MSTGFFADIRQLIAKGALEPALGRIGNAVEGARGELGNELSHAAILLSGRYAGYQLDRLKNVHSSADMERRLNTLTDNLLDFVALVESRWDDLPQPAAGPTPNSKDQLSDKIPRDSREAILAGNPLRRVAWLQRGLDVARAVCKIRTPEKLGTGFLVRGGKIVTNNHVLPSEAIAHNSFAIFDFEEDFFGRPTAPVPVKFASRTLKTNADPTIDCTVVGLDASLDVSRWGALELNCRPELPATTGVSIIQHPEGGFKQIAIAGNVISGSDPKSLRYVTSTMQGSSGAPVFDDDWRVLALHQGGGIWSEEQSRYLNNRGIRFSAICADSILAAEFS